MDMFPALLAICVGNPPVTGGFPTQRASNALLFFCAGKPQFTGGFGYQHQGPVMQNFDGTVVHLNNLLNKHLNGS